MHCCNGYTRPRAVPHFLTSRDSRGEGSGGQSGAVTRVAGVAGSPHAVLR